MNKKKKKRILLAFALIFTAETIAAPIIALKVASHLKAENVSYKFDGEIFSSKQAVFNYALSKAETEKSTDRIRHSWSISWDGQIKYFDNVRDLMNFLDKKIIVHKGTASTEIKLGEYGEVPSSELYKLNLNKEVKQTNVYRGRDNSIYSSEIDAKNSYLEIHDAYQFDNHFFRDKEELKNYLIINQATIKPSTDHVVIISPDNMMSSPIDINKLKNKDEVTINYINNFVNNYANKYIQIYDNKSNLYYYYTHDEIYKDIDNVTTIVEDYSKVMINSNQGLPNYIVDLDKEDKNNLYGPYYAKSSAALEKITDPNCWKQISSDENNIVTMELEVEQLSQFMESIVQDTEVLSEEIADQVDPAIVRKYRKAGIETPFHIDIIEKETNEYFQLLSSKAPKVYKSVMNTYNTIKQGKKYSTFYKLPILYIKTIESLMAHNCNQTLIDATFDYYKLVATKFDETLYAIVPSVFLWNDSRTEILSFAKLFKFGDTTFDFNTTLDAFTTIIVNEYPDFMKYIHIFGLILYTSYYFWDAIPYNPHFINKFFDVSLSEFSDEQVEALEKTWIMITTPDVDLFKEMCKEIFKDNIHYTGKEVPLSQEVMDALVYVFAFKCASAHINAEKELMKNLEVIKRANRSDYIDIISDKKSFFYNENFSFGFIEEIKNSSLLSRFENKELGVVDFLRMKYLYQQGRIRNIASHPIEEIKSLFIDAIVYSKFPTLVDAAKEFSTYLVLSEQEYSMLPLSPEEIERAKVTGIQRCEMFCEAALDLVGKATDLISALPNLLKKCKRILNLLTPCMPYVQAALAILDAIIPRFEHTSYAFETDDVRYVWDGGMRMTMFFGAVELMSKDVKDMKILPPQRITESHIVDGIYYNGKIYDSYEDGWKKEQLNDILRGRYNGNKNIKEVWSFRPLPRMMSNSPSTDAFQSRETLNEYVINTIIEGGDFIETKKVYKYANGYTLNGEHAIEEILNTIKPTKIATLPILKDNFPIIDDNKDIDNSVPSYILPGTSWTSARGEYVNTTDNQYIVVDPNVESKNYLINDENVPETTVDATATLKQKFYESFDVPSKMVVQNDLLNVNKFSQLSTNINTMNVYEVKLEYGYKRYFLDRGAALKWYLTKQNFAVQDSFVQQIKYIFNGQSFNNQNKYLKWVEENMEIIND